MIEEMGGYKVHPVASLFPMIPDDELRSLAEDIKVNGQREHIVLMPMGPETEEYWLVDGRNRFRACEMAGVEPQYGLDNRYFGEPDMIGPWIISHNLHRRHLTASQRAAIAVEYEHIYAQEAAERQRSGKPVDNGGKASDKAGEILGVSGRTVRDAKFVAEHDPDLFERVRSGAVSASSAARSARQNSGKCAECGDTFPVEDLTDTEDGTGELCDDCLDQEQWRPPPPADKLGNVERVRKQVLDLLMTLAREPYSEFDDHEKEMADSALDSIMNSAQRIKEIYHEGH